MFDLKTSPTHTNFKQNKIQHSWTILFQKKKVIYGSSCGLILFFCFLKTPYRFWIKSILGIRRNLLRCQRSFVGSPIKSYLSQLLSLIFSTKSLHKPHFLFNKGGTNKECYFLQLYSAFWYFKCQPATLNV